MSNAKVTVVAAVALAIASAAVAATLAGRGQASRSVTPRLGQLPDDTHSRARHIAPPHAMPRAIPGWKGLARGRSEPPVAPAPGRPYPYKKDGFEATASRFPPDQFATHPNPPAHWAPEY